MKHVMQAPPASDKTYVNELIKPFLIGSHENLIAKATGAADLENFVHKLRSNRPEVLHRTVAEAMLINETSFFRDSAQFELLRCSILPDLIKRNRNERKLAIWSAAGSTGQEAYSLAMMLCEHFPEVADWEVKILATDISRISLQYAAKGRYRRFEVNQGLPAQMLLKYFVRDGEEWKICEKVRSMVEFSAANLLSSTPLPLEFDLVLLRNVLLYFSEQDRSRALKNVHGVMRSHGALLLGHAEQAEDSSNLFETVFDADCYYYRPLKVL